MRIDTKDKQSKPNEKLFPKEWPDGAMVLGKLSVPGRSTNLDNSTARPIPLAVGAGGRLFGHIFLVYLFSFLSPSLGDGPIHTEILSQRAVNPKSPNASCSNI